VLQTFITDGFWKYNYKLAGVPNYMCDITITRQVMHMVKIDDLIIGSDSKWKTRIDMSISETTIDKDFGKLLDK
jgi:hypothetical protein